MPKLILASRSPRRAELLREAGYQFAVVPASEAAECGVCSRESPPELVARLARQKARDVALQTPSGIVIGCDTVADCAGQILGKPRDRDDAGRMLRRLRGREHRVYSGLCLWRRPDDATLTEVDVTTLFMEPIADRRLEEYLDSGAWEGKAGAFGYQDRLGWIRVLAGSESNVVGLPMELLQRLLVKLL